MKRNNLIETYFQRKQLLTTTRSMYTKHLDELFAWMSRADAVQDDVTTHLLQLTKHATAVIQAKQSGIVAGLEEVTYLLKQTDCAFLPNMQDGDQVQKGDIIAQINGIASHALGFERIVLNMLGRMSGIATTTHTIISSLQQSKFSHIASTRKTPWMLLDKKAVSVGGGLTHRLNLADWPLIKDTHLLLLKKQLRIDSIENTLVEAVKSMTTSSIDFFEIEVENKQQAIIVANELERNFLKSRKERVAAILLDNFSPKESLEIILKLQKKSMSQRMLFEISGQITPKNIALFAKIPADILSLGSLTHSSPVFDLSMSLM